MGDPKASTKPAKRGPGRPPLSPEARAASKARRLAIKADQQRERRAHVKAERARVASIVASSIVAAKGTLAEPKRGRAAGDFEPTPQDRARVEQAAAYGVPQDQIAMHVFNPATNRPITEDTLRRHFELELSQGPARANGLVGRSLFRKATGTGKGAVTAAIFWCKARMGWRETIHVEAEVRAGVLIAPANVSPHQWIEAARAADVEKIEPGAAERENT